MKRNDREMTGVLYGGVRGFWARKNIIITTHIQKTLALPITKFTLISQQNSCSCRGIPYKYSPSLSRWNLRRLSGPKIPVSLLIDAQRQGYFVQNTTLKLARKSRQFMRVHISSDEKFSSGLFARLEFLHSLQVVFQFIKHSFCARDRQVC